MDTNMCKEIMLTDDIRQVATIVKNGGLAIFPTDTVWGLGCSIERLDAIQRLYQIKGREPEKPTAVLVGSLQMAHEYGTFSQSAKELAALYWPGPLTLVMDMHASVPTEIRGKEGKVGLRYPKFSLIEELTNLIGCGIVTGSANFAGEPAPARKELIDQRLRNLVDVMLDGECGGEQPSTVVDVSGKEVKVLREGPISL